MRSLLRANQRQSFGRGPFNISRVFPGLPFRDPNDFGFGPLGVFDHANLGPGLLVSMHEHRDDEIFSYIRSGTLYHEDTKGGRLPLDPTHLCMMNSGYGISHEESIPHDGDSVEMLQIFVRPNKPELPPEFQYHKLTSAYSVNEWRLLVSPDKSAPFVVRNQVWIYDCQVQGEIIQTVHRPNHDALLYVFSGMIRISGDSLSSGDSMIFVDEEGPVRVIAQDTANLVLFIVDRTAEASRGGSLSG